MSKATKIFAKMIAHIGLFCPLLAQPNPLHGVQFLSDTTFVSISTQNLPLNFEWTYHDFYKKNHYKAELLYYHHF